MERKWFNRISVMDADDDAFSKFSCPRCGAPYPVSSMFDHDPRFCSKCESKLIEWNLIEFIYLIDYESAPGIVKNMIDYLEDKNEHDANKEVKSILNLLCLGID